MNTLTAYELSKNLNYCRTRIRGILSDIEFEEIEVEDEVLLKLEELYQKCEPILEYARGLSVQTRVNLSEDQQIMYDDTMKLVSDFDRKD